MTQEILSIIEILEREYGAVVKFERYLPILDLLVRYLLQDGEDPEDVKQAYQSLQEEFVDWNEVRVSHPREIGEVLQKDLRHQVQVKAQRIREVLSQVFHRCNRMDLEFLWEKDFSEHQKFIEQFPDIKEDFFSDLIRDSYYREDPPLTSTALRVGKRIGLWGDNVSPNTLRKTILKDIGQEDFIRLHNLLFLHGKQTCSPKGYECVLCAIAKRCSRGREESGRERKKDTALEGRIGLRKGQKKIERGTSPKKIPRPAKAVPVKAKKSETASRNKLRKKKSDSREKSKPGKKEVLSTVKTGKECKAQKTAMPVVKKASPPKKAREEESQKSNAQKRKPVSCKIAKTAQKRK